MTPTEIRLALIAGDYVPLPLFGKEPPVYGKNNQRKGLSDWEKLGSVTREMVEMWAKTWPDAINTGVLCKRTPTFDADLLNPEAVRAIVELVHERYDESGYVLTRGGKPPKIAIPFRTEEPFAKIVVNIIAPNGNAEKIEFLADGQQVVVAGIHPDTGKPYSWHGGEPYQLAREELPYIREQEARTLVEDVVELLVRDFGYQRAPERPKKKPHEGGDQAGAADWQFLSDNIREGRELHDSLCALAAKLIASGMAAAAVVNFLRAQIDSATCPHDERWRERRNEIPSLVDSAEAKFRQPAATRSHSNSIAAPGGATRQQFRRARSCTASTTRGKIWEPRSGPAAGLRPATACSRRPKWWSGATSRPASRCQPTRCASST
jgi:hypothetical protein